MSGITIPKGVVFDHGPQFKGYLLSALCSNLGSRLIHASVCHPQTNGKLERAFRDDRQEYYDQFDEWIRKNADGSVDVCFGPKAPEGQASNWIPTVADKAYGPYFRFYGPQPPPFAKTWKLPDLEPVR